jgi:hypothetical protein
MVYFLHVLLKLNLWFSLALLGYGLLILPVHRKIHVHAKEQEYRFFEVSLYLDTMLYAFVKEEKVEPAVRDVSQTLPEGRMQELTQQALDYLTLTYDEVEVMEEALALVEKEYPCKHIQDVHKFMVHVEYYGGEIEKPVNLLLASKSRWEKRIRETINARKKQLTDILLSVAASVFICGAMLYLPVMNMDIAGNLFVQGCAVVLLIVDDLVVLLAQRYLTADWIGLQLMEDEEYYLQKLEDFRGYDENKEKRLSYGLGAVSGCLGAVCFYFGREWLVVLMLLLTLLFVNQHRIGHKLLERRLKKAVQYAFPNWLLDLILLLQSENVQVALMKSREYVPGVLRRDLQLLTERLQMQPEEAKPYHQFLEDFSIPEIHSAMGILYSLSIGNSGNADRQIGELVEKNLEMLDVMESNLLKSSAAGMYVLFLVPVLTASFKLVIDMVCLMLQFLQAPLL